MVICPRQKTRILQKRVVSVPFAMEPTARMVKTESDVLVAVGFMSNAWRTCLLMTKAKSVFAHFV
jgi:hypothetical protein